MLRLAILCGLCLAVTGGAASGASLGGSSSAGSALTRASATSFVAGRLPQTPDIAHSSTKEGRRPRGTVTRAAHAAPLILLGERAIEPTVAGNAAGTVEGFAFRALRSGSAISISVYLDARDRATTLFAGLYSSRNGRPRSLLTSGSRRFPKAGAWDSVAVHPISVQAGATYWLAILGKGGAIRFRDRNGRFCTGQRSSRRKSHSLPTIWPAGPNSHSCLLAAYVKGSARAGTKGTNGSGGSGGVTSPVTPPASTAPPLPGVNAFCNNPAAYNNLDTGPHLCGWPDSTNTGYVNAPGYPGSLTQASSSSSTCPTTIQSNHTYEFCLYGGGSGGEALRLPANLSDVTFYGDEFETTNPNNANLTAGSGDNNITFNYDTFQPTMTYSPEVTVACSQSYEYGIYNEGAQMGGYTVENSNFWGFGGAIDTAGSTQANPQIFKYNWIHDASTTGGCGYHVDGIGNLNNGTEEYATVDHNTIEFTGNSNLIAWQNGTYSHDQNTNNLLSGDNEGYAGARCTSGCTAPTYIVTAGNTFNTYLSIEGDYPIDNATHYWSSTGSIWQHNYWAVPSGAAWGTPAFNGYYWVPTANSNYPSDCGFVSATDYPTYSNRCAR